MPAINQAVVAAYFAQGDDPNGTTTTKGRALEDLICYVFSLLPDVTVTSRNKMNAFNTEEIDVAFYNERAQLPFLPYVLLVECKNWSNPVGSQEVAYFAARLRHRGCDHGILVANKGITGDPNGLSAANFQLATALQEGVRILVLLRTDLEALDTTDDLVALLKEKLCLLAVAGTVY